MSERTGQTIQKVCEGIILRAEGLEMKSGKKRDEMALNYFIGATKLAEILGDEELFNHMQKTAVFCVSIRGWSEVERLAKGEA